MNQKSKIYILTLMLIFTSAACNKNNKTAKRLAGAWVTTADIRNGTPLKPLPQVRTTFIGCKANKKWCGGSAVEWGVKTDFQWKIAEKGMQYLTREDENTPEAEYVTATIDELTETTFKYTTAKTYTLPVGQGGADSTFTITIVVTMTKE